MDINLAQLIFAAIPTAAAFCWSVVVTVVQQQPWVIPVALAFIVLGPIVRRVKASWLYRH